MTKKSRNDHFFDDVGVEGLWLLAPLHFFAIVVGVLYDQRPFLDLNVSQILDGTPGDVDIGIGAEAVDFRLLGRV